LVAAALENGAVRASDWFDCEEGHFRVPGKTIRDSHPHGDLDVAGILRVSSNIGATKIAYRLGPQSYYDTLRKFSFGALTASGFPEESAGLLRPWRDWRPVDHANLAFGQGVSVTPMQLITATAALANGGVWRPPRLLSAKREPGAAWRPLPRSAERRVIRAETAATLRSMLEGVVGPEGTGKGAALGGLRVAGKTGTAQKLDPRTRSYDTNRFLAWFVGFVPAENPVLVLLTMLDEPQGLLHTGGAVAAPLFAEVATAQLARLGILVAPPQIASAGSPRTPSPQSLGAAPPHAVGSAPPARPAAATPGESQGLASFAGRTLLPDFRGLSLQEVRQLTEQSRLELEAIGEGHAVTQDPEPGTILNDSKPRVRVRFETLAGKTPCDSQRC